MDPVLNTDLTGRRVAHYGVVGLIGSGGMGKVYLARDEQLRRHVAIKVVLNEAAEKRQPRGLLAEARALSQLIHPSVAAIYDFITQPDREYIVMEFVPGATMKEVLNAGPLPTEEVVRLGLQLARGVAAAHAARVLHRDLKPQNLKLTSSGQLKILDFGVAAMLTSPRLVDRAMDTPTSLDGVGTVPYMSPEQLRGGELDERSDIFSIGAVLYEMAAGVRAFPQRHIAQLVEAIQHHNPAPLCSVNPFVPRAIERVVSKALQKDPNQRHRLASVLAAELRRLRSTPQSYSAARDASARHNPPVDAIHWRVRNRA